jgi:hypothetical protein
VVKLERNHFTGHGMHLNFKGKELFTQPLAMIVEQFFRKEQTAIPCKVSILGPNNTETQDLNTEINTEGKKKTELAHFSQY